MSEETLLEVMEKLTDTCYPYGSETYDGERYKNLLLKIAIVEKLVDEIIDAGKLYNRHEYSILRISNKANQYLTDLRDWLCNIDYLPKEYDNETCERETKTDI